MKGWRLYLSVVFFPLCLCGVFLLIAARNMATVGIAPRGAVIAVGMLLIAPMTILMFLTLPWHEPEPEIEEMDIEGMDIGEGPSTAPRVNGPG